MIGFEIEKALKLLVEFFPIEEQKKPALFHSIRVCTYLYKNGYPEYLCIAGLLHDALEDTEISEEVIITNFGADVLEIVKANSKNNDLPKDERLEDIVKRCVNYGELALIVKTVDVYDNFQFYVKEGIFKEIDRCKYLAELIIKYKLESWHDDIFKHANTIINYK